MEAHVDANEAIWKSDSIIKHWNEQGTEREQKRAAQFTFMGELLPFNTNDAFTFLDLGAGTGAAARGILSLYPNAKAVLADYSPQMMGEGTKLLSAFEGRYRYVEFDMNTSNWPASIPTPLEAVITSQCVHHLPDERKQTLFAEILERLKPGAWYVNFDPVKAADPEVEAVWQRVNDRSDPRAAEKRAHRTEHELAMRENHLRYMVDLERQVGFMRQAGFRAVDVYWKQLDYVIYAGHRPS